MHAYRNLTKLILDDFRMRKLPHRAAEDLVEIVIRRYERFSALLTSHRPVEDWRKLLRNIAAVNAMLDRPLHQRQVLKCRSLSDTTTYQFWRSEVQVAPLPAKQLTGF
jgi:DNA replication protein DnaC